MHDLKELNNLFDAEIWLRDNYGCEFYPSSNGWTTSSCPFDDHEDSSPSFGINKEKYIFNCFGCGKNGDFINLVQLITGFDFSKTIKFMAEYSNINLKDYSSDDFVYTKFRKAFEEIENESIKNKRLIRRATLKIKKHLKVDFGQADQMYKELDNLITQEDYKQISKKFL